MAALASDLSRTILSQTEAAKTFRYALRIQIIHYTYRDVNI